MEKKITRRNFLKQCLAVAGTLFIPVPYALACGKERNFFEAIKPSIKNYGALREDKDGKLYSRFNVDLKTLNHAIENPQDIEPTPNIKGRLYNTLEEAIKDISPKSSPETTFILEFDLGDRGFSPGRITNAYDRKGKKLKSKPNYRCWDTTLRFEK